MPEVRITVVNGEVKFTSNITDNVVLLGILELSKGLVLQRAQQPASPIVQARAVPQVVAVG